MTLKVPLWLVLCVSVLPAVVMSFRRLPVHDRGSRLLLRMASTEKYKSNPPTPKRFTVRPDQVLNVAAASFPLVTRLGSGITVSGYKVGIEKTNQTTADAQSSSPAEYALFDFGGRRTVEGSALGARPAKPVVLYEFEGCPFCKKVREAVSILDLDVEMRPCPKDGTTYREYVSQTGGKKMFPYLEDPNTGTKMYESDDIIQYLFDQYGDGKVPSLLTMGALTTITAGLGLAPRLGRGSSCKPSKKANKSLELWGYEGSPFVKLVREVLCERELPYLMLNCARGSPKRQELYERQGTFQVPYLEDPNTGVKMFESAEIVEYLNSEYGVETEPSA
uniref:GST N-terminal domain-containing protein n=1 Tax=Chromera velia CCMP2878 TaxID=1169474 RepID=A0A0G4FZI0_9ALVE|mmetsp:Transcript_33021/g.65431  ORF Transcript_33021/g.65431 Transcript_33021/m.65431 type:complete len:334 (+) Transcript_33021:65-1066(+)|eukprot:Cvel_19545.t1-p1 / transcript=Cvel_19545.t1 / gene=Cvel_19545 / organism=Chromera_velia_CCMP2878 / gene_product=hypothetical protein / transcript_product=hypothetical protein / location=Cvel_scaffold1693:37430-38428(+) / protein_length=333 / sequence_SO=supercontig / SO=protein_coding / is_pseudo=false